MPAVSYNDGNILLRWSNMTEGGPVFLDSSTEHMPQFEVVGIDAKEFSVARRDQGTVIMGVHDILPLSVVFYLDIGT